MLIKADHKIDIQGHRGCRGLYPENSLSAFSKAIDLGVNTLELDVAITKDNEVIVSHEPFISRNICLNPEGDTIDEKFDMQYNLYQMTHNEIKQFDCGTKFHPDFPNQKKVKAYKPLLSEVFDLIKAKNSEVRVNIEIKSESAYYNHFTPEPKDYVRIVLDTLKKNQFYKRVNLQSFDLNIMEEIYKQDSVMQVTLLVNVQEDINTKLSLLSYKPQIVGPYFKLLNNTLVNDLKQRNFKVIPWTVNTKEDLKQMIDFKVDGIITDYPNRLLKML